ncbi:DUF3108 domain-containing protein [Candidatus Poribacteria bacterium]|nr:DUF3108 domain-containing protein [Candidatus Poribacteria bacterium]
MKSIYFTIALLFFVFLFGCGDETPTKETKDEVVEPVLDYYPDNVGSKWIYLNAEGQILTRTIKEGEEFSGITYKMWQAEPPDAETEIWQAESSDSEAEQVFFRKTIAGIRLYTKEIDKSIMKLIKEDFKPLQGWALFNFTVQSSFTEGLLVELPLKPGLDWLVIHIRAAGTLLGGKNIALTLRFTGHSSRKEIITVPAGTFECIRVTYKYEGKLEIAGEIPSSYTETMYVHWLAPDVGIVQIKDAYGTFQLIEYDLTL